jgi:hypothetical protein
MVEDTIFQPEHGFRFSEVCSPDSIIYKFTRTEDDSYKYARAAFLTVYLEFLDLTGLRAGRRSHFYGLTAGLNYYIR